GDTCAYGQRTKLPAGNIARALGKTGQIIVVTHALASDGANGDERTRSPHMLRSPARESQATAWRGIQSYHHAEQLLGTRPIRRADSKAHADSGADDRQGLRDRDRSRAA